jgi:hypothetical protein
MRNFGRSIGSKGWMGVDPEAAAIATGCVFAGATRKGCTGGRCSGVRGVSGTSWGNLRSAAVVDS